MKRNVFILIAATISAVSIINCANAQFNSQENALALNPEPASTFIGKALNNIPSRALRDFFQSFKDVSDERWYVIKNGYIARFNLEAVQYRVDYDSKGHWISTTRFLSDSRMPAKSRAIVKSSYYDCQITLVVEIETRSEKAYIVNLEDETSWKKISLRNGELSVLEDYLKK